MQQDYKLIEDYIAGNLSPEERKSFELRLLEDSAFKESFELQQSMNAFLVKENNKAKVLPQLEALGKKHFEETEAKSVSFNRRRLYAGLAIAASIAVLIFALGGLFEKPLYQQYAQHQPINLIEKSAGDPIAALAQNQFNAKDYEAAYTSLSEYLSTNPDDTKALLAKGIAALELGYQQESIRVFEGIHSGSTALKGTGTWYLGLAYLKAEVEVEAKTYLEQVPASEGALYRKAQKLLREL